jgi:hypothetical protein
MSPTAAGCYSRSFLTVYSLSGAKHSSLQRMRTAAPTLPSSSFDVIVAAKAEYLSNNRRGTQTFASSESCHTSCAVRFLNEAARLCPRHDLCDADITVELKLRKTVQASTESGWAKIFSTTAISSPAQ